MKRLSRALITLLLTFLSPLAAGSALASDRGAPLKSRTFEFHYEAWIEEAPVDSGEIRLWVPYPRSDASQEIRDLRVTSSSPAAVYVEPRHENLVLYTSVPSPSDLPLKLSLRFTVTRREHLKKEFHRERLLSSTQLDPEVRRHLEGERLVPLTPEVREWAHEVTDGAETVLEKARAIYDYAFANITYDKSGSGWGQGNLLYVCDEKRGNCTDFHALFIGFARAVGIPARFSIGFQLPAERGAGEISGYHCWAEFYLPGYGWVPIDASEAWKTPEKKDYYFGGHDENRIQFTTGRDLLLRPRQGGGPLNYFIYPYAEAGGFRLEGVRHRFSFRDLRDGTFVLGK